MTDAAERQITTPADSHDDIKLVVPTPTNAQGTEALKDITFGSVSSSPCHAVASLAMN